MNNLNDLIPRAAAIDAVLSEERYCERNMDDETTAAVQMARFKLEKVQVVDAAPVVHGRWIKMTSMMPPEYHGHYECSECQWHMKGLRNSWTREEELSYCPNCGAKMKKE